MRKIFVVILALLATAFVVEAKPKEIKLIEDTPRHSLKSSKSTLVLEGNDVTIVPVKDGKHTRFTIDQQFDFTDYKAMSFTLENLEDKPVIVNLYITHAGRKYVTQRRRTVFQTTGDCYFLQPGEKRNVVLNFQSHCSTQR